MFLGSVACWRGRTAITLRGAKGCGDCKPIFSARSMANGTPRAAAALLVTNSVVTSAVARGNLWEGPGKGVKIRCSPTSPSQLFDCVMQCSVRNFVCVPMLPMIPASSLACFEGSFQDSCHTEFILNLSPLRQRPWQSNIEGTEWASLEGHLIELLWKRQLPIQISTWPVQCPKLLQWGSAAANQRWCGSLWLWSTHPWWRELTASPKSGPCWRHPGTWAPVQGRKGAKAPNHRMKWAWARNPSVWLRENEKKDSWCRCAPSPRSHRPLQNLHWLDGGMDY